MSDILADDEKRILIVTCNKQDSVNSFRFIKKDFHDSYMKITTKTIANGFITTNLLHVSENKNAYIVYGDWFNSKNGKYKNGVYVYQTNDSLNDLFADTILNVSQTKDQVFTNSRLIATKENNASYIAVWSWNKPTVITKTLKNDQLTNVPGVFDEGNNDQSIISLENSVHRIFSYNEYTPTSNDDFPKPYSPDYNKLIEIPRTNSFITTDNLNTKFSLLGLEDSVVKWQLYFSNKIDSSVLSDLSEAKVIYNNKAVHIVYAIYPKHKHGLAQINISANGTYTKNEFIGWESSYSYNLTNSIFSKNNLYIPCTKGNKIRFAKIKIE